MKSRKITRHNCTTDPGVNFINILRTNFSCKCRFGSFFYVHVTRKKLPKESSYKKFRRKMLMKLTPDRIHVIVTCRRFDTIQVSGLPFDHFQFKSLNLQNLTFFNFSSLTVPSKYRAMVGALV